LSDGLNGKSSHREIFSGALIENNWGITLNDMSTNETPTKVSIKHIKMYYLILKIKRY